MMNKSRSGTTVQVSGRASGLILIIIGLILLGVAALVYSSSGGMHIKTNLNISPETVRYIFSGVPAGIGCLLFLSGLVGVVRGKPSAANHSNDINPT